METLKYGHRYRQYCQKNGYKKIDRRKNRVKNRRLYM